MGMIGSSSGINADLNVTPMIDILLVLLIIFMIMIPDKTLGLNAIVPQDSPDSKQPQPESLIVIQVQEGATGAAPNVKLNQQPVAWNELPDELAKIYLKRNNKSAFLKADGELDFQEVASVIDVAHQSGIVYVGLMTKEPAAR
jgi:biopolymer transport protein TolR